MNIEQYVDQLLEFVRTHHAWAAPVIFCLAFAESLAFVSLLVPAWAVLVGMGALIQSSGLNFWPIWLAASAGAALGDWLSYWIGQKFGYAIADKWPLNKHPQLLPKGEVFMRKWGMAGIFIGRFFGPLRAAVPLIAGIFHMDRFRFQLANWSSALVWAAVVLLIGDVAGKAIGWLWNH
jgi:membrane protein DedA with SNARE-associated domain